VFEPIITTRKDPDGQVVTRYLEGPIVETTYSGHCDRAMVASVAAVTADLMTRVPHLCWLLDLTAVTSLDTDAQEPGRDILRLFREGGGDRFAFAVKMSKLRFLMASVGFAMRLPLKAFATRDEALAHLREYLAAKKRAATG
jgi:hypothetical protein